MNGHPQQAPPGTPADSDHRDRDHRDSERQVMTTPKHRTTHTAAADRLGEHGLKGAAPLGVWWVAWRQHRVQIAVLLAVMAASAAALVIFRSRIVAVYAEAGCQLSNNNCTNADGVSVWWNYGLSTWSSLAHFAMLGGPIALGAFAAAPIFTREFSRGTHVFALTQSVGRTRWFVAKVTVMVVPLVGGLLVLGYLLQWTDKTVGITAYGALNQSNFFTRGIIPAATGLMTFGLTIAIGMYARTIVTTLVVGALAGGAILVGVALIQPHVLPAQRTVTTLADMYRPLPEGDVADQDRNAAYLDNGYLDANGKELNFSKSPLGQCYGAADKAGEAAAAAAGLTTGGGASAGVTVGGSGGAVSTGSPGQDYHTSPEYQNAYSAAIIDCLHANGIAAGYTDVLPGSMLWPLRWAISGILLALAAAFTGIGARRLRTAIAKR